MISYGYDMENEDATNFVDWYKIERENRKRLEAITICEGAYPVYFVTSGEIRKRELAEKSQIATREIGRRKEKMRLNTKGWQRLQYFNKMIV